MKRRGVRAMGTLFAAVVLGGLVPATAAGAAKPVVTAQADLSCYSIVSGTLKFSPPLRTTPAPTTMTAKVKVACESGATGFAGVTVTSVKVTAAAAGTYGCADINVPYPQLMSNGTMHLAYKWKATGGKVLPTTVNTANWALRDSSYLVFSGGAEPPPSSVATGSYSTRYPTMGVGTAADTDALCASPKGLKKVTLNSAGLAFLALG